MTDMKLLGIDRATAFELRRHLKPVRVELDGRGERGELESVAEQRAHDVIRALCSISRRDGTQSRIVHPLGLIVRD